MPTNLLSLIIIWAILSLYCWWLPLAMLASAAILLAVERPSVVPLVLFGVAGVILRKTRDPRWQKYIAELGAKYDSQQR